MIPLLLWGAGAVLGGTLGGTVSGAMVGGLVGGVLGYVIVKLLKYAELKKWFRQNTEVDKDNIRAVFQEALANGEYKVIQCGFNTKRKEVTAIKAYQTEDRDSELIELGREAIITEES